MREPSLRANGLSDAGRVRRENEDCFVSDSELGLFAVFDGMGGHNAGDVASTTARNIIYEFVSAHRHEVEPRLLLDTALQKASAAVHNEAQLRRDLQGMGTTAVCLLVVDDTKAVVAHVGDSRAYLLREARLRLLTQDHTVVAELLARNAISPEDALHHPYKSVLSRNLGGKPEATIDLLDVELEPGDRILLCSDGLNGYASQESIEHALAGAESPEAAASDLVTLALRGGGGDNVTALVVDIGSARLAPSTEIIRTSGAAAWWQQRERFLTEARLRNVARSPICSVLSEEEAVDIVAGNLFEAIFHDLAQTTGINVWTYTENLANGWLDQEGSCRVIRDLLNELRGAAEVVLASIAAEGQPFAIALEVAVMRALVVAEMALGSVIGERIRVIEAELAVRGTQTSAFASEGHSEIRTEIKTTPRLRAHSATAAPRDVVAHLERVLELADRELSAIDAFESAGSCLSIAHRAAIDGSGEAELLPTARELYGARSLNDAGITPLLDALDQARSAHFGACRRATDGSDAALDGITRTVGAHVALTVATAMAVVEAGQPITDGLREVAERTAALRAEVGRGETRIAELEREYLAQRTGR